MVEKPMKFETKAMKVEVIMVMNMIIPMKIRTYTTPKFDENEDASCQ